MEFSCSFFWRKPTRSLEEPGFALSLVSQAIFGEPGGFQRSVDARRKAPVIRWGGGSGSPNAIGLLGALQARSFDQRRVFFDNSVVNPKGMFKLFPRPPHARVLEDQDWLKN